MSKINSCPLETSLEWRKLVEETGDYNDAYRIWRENGEDYPADIIAEAERERSDNSMDIDTTIDPRVLEQKKELDRAKEIIGKKIEHLKFKPFPSEIDNQTLADLESTYNDLNTLDAKYAFSSFIDTAFRMGNSAKKYLEQVKKGEKDPEIYQYHRIKEFEETFTLIQDMIPEMEDIAEFSEDIVKGREALSKLAWIKKERLLQQRQLLADKWANGANKYDAIYREKAERQFNKEEAGRYNKKDVKKAREKYIEEYMLRASGEIRNKTKQNIIDVLSKIDDVGSFTNSLMNPKDLHNQVVDMVSAILDEADFAVRQSTIDEVWELDTLYKEYVKYVGGTAAPEKLYEPILEKDAEGNLTGRYINPESYGNQYNEMKKKYADTPVMALYTHIVRGQFKRDKGLRKSARLRYNLPAVNKTGLERLQSQGIVDSVTSTVTDFTKLKDTTELGELYEGTAEDSGRVVEIITAESGAEKKFIPIHFRNKNIEAKDRSYDLITITALEIHNTHNYIEKTNVATEIGLILDSVENAPSMQREGMSKKLKVSRDTKRAALLKKGQANVIDALNNIIDNRLYGVRLTGSKKVAHRTNQIKGYASYVALGGNIFSASANYLQGYLATWIESFGGKEGLFSAKNRLNGSIKYNKDLHNNVKDLNNNIATSKTNLLLQLLDSSEQFNPLTKEYVRTNVLKKHLNKDLYLSLQNTTEHMIRGTLLYSILDNIKVKDVAGNYISKNGKSSTKNREEAMTLDEAFTTEKGKLVLNPKVASTERTPGTNMLAVSKLVGRSSRELFGNYNPENRSIFERTALGNLIMHMRGWMPTGIAKRWKGIGTSLREADKLEDEHILYNAETGQIEEGTYTTTIRFFANVLRKVKVMKIKAWSSAKQELTEREAMNLRRFAAEFALITLAFLASTALDDDEDDEVRMAAAYLSRRMYAEFFTFANPLEFTRTARSPAMSLNLVEDGLQFILQGLEDTYNVATTGDVERYKSGRRYKEPKLKKEAYDLFPLLKHLNKDVGEQYKFYTR